MQTMTPKEDEDGPIMGVSTYALTLNYDVVTYSYTYGDSAWGDKLTKYRGTTITYDAIGNPLSYYNGSTYAFTWEGRRLVGATKSGTAMSFTYDDNGLRTSKTVEGVTTTYIWNGSQLFAEMTDSYVIVYVYEADGSPLGMQYLDLTSTDAEWEIYWFEKNLQGDVIAVYDDSGAKHLKYTYDAWGNVSVSYMNGGSSSVATKNPFRYRGYYYDTALGLYYLQSRYYDAKIGRFINADGYVSTGTGLLGYNMFVYCSNNPVNFYDPAGRNEAALIAGLLGISVADGPLPIGDIIAALVITAYVFGYVAKADDALNVSPPTSNSAGEDATEEPPQSITEPEETLELDDDGRPVVKPGQQPTERDGYLAPKAGPVKGKTKDGKTGWKDKNGNIWVSAPTGTSAGHGGGHWDVQSPKGGYTNVYPGGKIRGGKSPLPNIPILP